MRILLVVWLTGLGVVAGIGSGAAQGSAPSAAPAATDSEIETLRERVAAYWAARVAGDAETQWRLLEPRGSGRITAQEYGAAPQGGRYLAYQVEDATINGYFATVKVRLVVQQILPSPGAKPLPPVTTYVEDGWVRIKGVWYRRFDAGSKASP